MQNGLFVGIRRKVQDNPKPARITPNLAVWHWRDDETPLVKAWAREQARQFSYLSYIDLERGRFVRLADEELAYVRPHPRGQSLLGSDGRAHSRTNASARSIQDYYLVDLHSGQRRPIVTQLIVMMENGPRMSPDGRSVVYQENGDFISYDTATGVRRNITAGLRRSSTIRRTLAAPAL